MQKKEFSLSVGGRKMTALFSDLSENANGSVILTCGETSVLATAVMSSRGRENIDFFPLVVDYEERFYAAGEILGSRFIRREGRPTDEAILGGRIVDRTIRPLFDKRIRNEVQIVITVLSLGEEDPDVIAINAASLALLVSDIPWNGPVSAVRIGKEKGIDNLSVNPTYEKREPEVSELDAVICGKEGVINMVEVGAYNSSEDIVEQALRKAENEIKSLQEFQKKIASEIGKEKIVMEMNEISEKAVALFQKEIAPQMEDALFGKDNDAYHTLKHEWISLYKESFPEEMGSLAGDYIETQADTLIHKEAIENDRRADGRGMDEVRSLFVQAGGVSPMLHGSGIFYRGGTHVLSILTLGGPKDAQLIDSIETHEGEKRFMHHYNFPPFSVGETGRVGGMNRRMIGHGALAEKALLPVIPQKDEFPYTIRVVSEALASNGSTSMGSVCASSVALMDAGVPIAMPVAGIAMGLMMEDSKKYKILTDIQGPEDHHGDMDFKVAGTRAGVTAVQMDVKVEGVPVSILIEALEKAKKTRLFILDTIEKEIKGPREELQPKAPRVVRKKIDESKIGLVIGPSGQTIRRITKESGAQIDIEDDGTVFILGKNGSAEKAEALVEDIVHEYVSGERLEGEVTRILDFGAFVRVSPHAEGLVHVSEMAPVRINAPSDLVKEGDRVPVVVKEVDERGRLNLSIKKADDQFFKDKLLSLPKSEAREGRTDERREGFRQKRWERR